MEDNFVCHHGTMLQTEIHTDATKHSLIGEVIQVFKSNTGMMGTILIKQTTGRTSQMESPKATPQQIPQPL